MSSNQANLRRLMQIERGKKAAKPKSILKSKSTTHQTNKFSLNIGKRKRDSGCTRNVEETEMAEQGKDGTDEFEDFMNSNDDEETEVIDTDRAIVPKGKEPIETKDNNDDDELKNFMDSVDNADAVDEKETKLLNDKSSNPPIEGEEKLANEQGADIDQLNEVEQAAYGARLAKLMLLTRRKKKKLSTDDQKLDPDNTAEDFGSTLVLETIETDENGKNQSTAQRKEGKGKAKNSSSLKDIMRKKQKKKKDPKNLDDDDSYWTNF